MPGNSSSSQLPSRRPQTHKANEQTRAYRDKPYPPSNGLPKQNSSRTVAGYGPTVPSYKAESASHGLRRQQSRRDLRTTAHYSERPLPPLPSSATLQRSNATVGRGDKELRMKPFPSRSTRMPFGQDYADEGQARFHDGPERRVRTIEVSPASKYQGSSAVVRRAPEVMHRSFTTSHPGREGRKQAKGPSPSSRAASMKSMYADDLFRK